jgi:hypothetical protein
MFPSVTVYRNGLRLGPDFPQQSVDIFTPLDIQYTYRAIPMKTLKHVVLMMGIPIPLVRGQDQAELDKLIARLNVIPVDSGTLYKLQQYGGPRVNGGASGCF